MNIYLAEASTTIFLVRIAILICCGIHIIGNPTQIQCFTIFACRVYITLGPVFKKPADTKKSGPSDSIGFQKNRPNSVKIGRNSFD
jgi:hypothetical protein